MEFAAQNTLMRYAYVYDAAGNITMKGSKHMKHGGDSSASSTSKMRQTRPDPFCRSGKLLAPMEFAAQNTLMRYAYVYDAAGNITMKGSKHMKHGGDSSASSTSKMRQTRPDPYAFGKSVYTRSSQAVYDEAVATGVATGLGEWIGNPKPSTYGPL